MKIITPKISLLSSLKEILSVHRKAFIQERSFCRCSWMVLGTVFAFGRKTMTQIITGLGRQNDDWTAFYRILSRNRFCYDTLVTCLLDAAVKSVSEGKWIAAAIDVTHVMRSSNTMPGTSWGKAPRTAPFKPGTAHKKPDKSGHLAISLTNLGCHSRLTMSHISVPSLKSLRPSTMSLSRRMTAASEIPPNKIKTHLPWVPRHEEREVCPKS
jgi:hypothetical protein